MSSAQKGQFYPLSIESLINGHSKPCKSTEEQKKIALKRLMGEKILPSLFLRPFRFV
jgi:hypothetical protein